jgi:FtsZ-interacting cell division protein YlmF
MGNKVKTLWQRFTARDEYEHEEMFDDEGNALDMDNHYESGYDSGTERNEKVMHLHKRHRHNLRLYMLEGHNWQQTAKKAAEELRNGCSVIINTEKANKDAVGRMADFLGGVAFAIDGRIVKHGSSWGFVPDNTDLGGDIYEESNYPFDGSMFD